MDLKTLRDKLLDAVVDIAIWLFKAAIACAALELLWRIAFTKDSFFYTWFYLWALADSIEKSVAGVGVSAVICVVIYTATRRREA
jgi:hypothetical protein